MEYSTHGNPKTSLVSYLNLEKWKFMQHLNNNETLPEPGYSKLTHELILEML